MGHGLEVAKDGSASMAYVIDEGHPWHALGQPIKKGAKPAEVAKAAKLDWRVDRRGVRFDVDDNTTIYDKDHQVIYRADTNAVLDVTGKGYVPHQNIEVLEFFQEYLDAGEMFIDTAGALFGGKYIWVQAKIGDAFNVGQGDPVLGRVLLMNPHQYGKGMIGKIVMERVVCHNTLQMAMGEGGKSIKVPHIKEFNKARQDEAKRNLGIARERVTAFKADAIKLTKLNLGTDALDILIKVFDGKEGKPLEEQNRTITRLFELYSGAGIGAQLKTASGTGWGLLNAVTQYYDHEYGRTLDARVQSAWLGAGDIKKREMMTELLAVAA